MTSYREDGCLDVPGRRKMPHPFQLSVILRYIRLVGDPRSLFAVLLSFERR